MSDNYIYQMDPMGLLPFISMSKCKSLITLCNVCAVVWGCSVLWGILWWIWEDILRTVGVVQYREGISWVLLRVILSSAREAQYGGDTMMHVGDIMSTWACSVLWGIASFVIWVLRGYHDTCGEYHEYWGGCSVPWGYSNNKNFSSTVPNIPMVLKISPRTSWYPHGTQDNP